MKFVIDKSFDPTIEVELAKGFNECILVVFDGVDLLRVSKNDGKVYAIHNGEKQIASLRNKGLSFVGSSHLNAFKLEVG